ncbi:MAG: penicillin acylase family protein [Myxococcota bacterium]
MKTRPLLSVLGLLTWVSGCSGGSGSDEYRATIRTTAYGVPHVVAEDWGSLGFGQGYSGTRDRGCIVADQVLKARGERSRFLGRGEDDVYLNQDFAFKSLGLVERAEAAFPTLSERNQDLIRGYVAGYNLYLEENGSEGFPGWCAGEAWVRPITEIDYLAYVFDGALLASGAVLADFVGGAQPPSASASIRPAASDFESALTELTVHASNGWAIGSDRSESGRGMVMTNPQFGWHGATQFRENHLTIPGELDVYGASFGGFFGIQVGFNENVAWTHTVSDGNRFVVYDLELVPGNPTRYRYDDEVRDMTSREVTVEVLGEDGSVQEVSRTMWSSHYGPVIEVPQFGEWTEARALSYRDANAENEEIIDQWLQMNLATSMDDFQRVFEEVQGIPWVNTMAASSDGRAWYMDGSATPNLSDEALAIWLDLLENNAIIELFFDFGVVLLDGSDSRFEWVEEEGARDPGLVPFAKQPKLERRDVVHNANQSHWIANSAAPLEGYTPLMGFERQRLPLRPRMVGILVEDDTAAGQSGPDGKFSLEELEQVYMVNRGLSPELLRDEVVDRCTGAEPVATDSGPVDLAEACDILRDWNLRYDVESVGPVLWRQTFSTTNGTGYFWEVPFDPEDPLGTPSGIVDPEPGEPDFLLSNMANAILQLESLGFSIDVPLGDIQFTEKGDERIPMHGGIARDGVANIGATIINFADSLEPTNMAPIVDGNTTLTAEGYYADRGPAIVMAIEFNDDGPRATSIAAYSQSKDPNSPHYADQTRLYSMKQFKPVLFRDDDIMADPELEVLEISAPRTVEE